MKTKKGKTIQGKLCWQCSKCRCWCDESSFYSDKRTANGLKSQCKECHIETSILTRDRINTRKINREHMRRARKTDPAKFRKREASAALKRPKGAATRARVKLNTAVRAGIIIKPMKCEKCNGKHRLTAHHEDYSKPLEVIWLCYECHGELSWQD